MDERKRVTRRLFGKAGFVQVILTSAGNLAPPNTFVDMILRRLNHGAGIWICLTKTEGGYLNGILNLGGPACRIRIAATMTMKRAANGPLTVGFLIGAVRDLALLAAVSRPSKSALKDYVSPSFAYLALGPLKVSFQSRLGLRKRGQINLPIL